MKSSFLTRSEFKALNEQMSQRWRRVLEEHFGDEVLLGAFAQLPRGQVWKVEGSTFRGENSELEAEVMSFSFRRGSYVNTELDIDRFFEINNELEDELGLLISEGTAFDEIKQYLADAVYSKDRGDYVPYSLAIWAYLKKGHDGEGEFGDGLLTFSVNSSNPDHYQVEGIGHGSRARYEAFFGDKIDLHELQPSRRRRMYVAPIWKERRFFTHKDRCFVLMPFNEPWSDRIWNRHVRPMIKSTGLDPIRADDLYGQEIMEDIWRSINEARVIVADITGRNPNVFYELGIAHTLGKDVVLLTQSTEDIPFDLRPFRHVVYEDNSDGYDMLEEQLRAMIRGILQS